ncbi:unnamed protein product [Closterium sp. NIES-64]|nr:unnamed protein product [Closterium sp. NIES-64]CAI5959327.1 unnamed protein product [Closterium sp. NIES-65]
MLTLAWLARQARRAAQFSRSEAFTTTLLAAARAVTLSALILYLLITTSTWLEPERRPPNYPVPQFPQFHVDPSSGRIRDAYNRERVFHGVNAVFKGPPWHPPVLDSFHPELSFSPADFAILQTLGLNVVRLGVMWPGVHPARGETNATYLHVMKRMVRQMRAAGIYTLVDFHQDVFGSRFCGEGAPSWLFDEQTEFHLLPRGTLDDEAAERVETTEATGTSVTPEPAETAAAAETTATRSHKTFPLGRAETLAEAKTGENDMVTASHASESPSGTPGTSSRSNSQTRRFHTSDPDPKQCERHSWSDYHFTYAVARAFQDLYENRWGWRDRMADYWAEVARAFRDEDGVLGYDLLNEPWVGDEFSNPMLMAPGVADKLNLAPLYEHLQAAIRAEDPSKLIAFETVTFDDAVSGLRWVPGGQAWRNMSVLSYHHYRPPNVAVRATMKQRMAERKRLQCGAMLTEFSLPSIPLGIKVGRSRRNGLFEMARYFGRGNDSGGERLAERALMQSNSSGFRASGCTVHRRSLQRTLHWKALPWAERRAQSAAGKAVVRGLLSCGEAETGRAVQMQAEKDEEGNAEEVSNTGQPSNGTVDPKHKEDEDPGPGAWKEMEELLDAADEHVQSWMAWEYKAFLPITGANLGLFHRNGSLNMRLGLLLARTYPQAVAGRILQFFFNSSAASFHLSYLANHPLPPDRHVRPTTWLFSSKDADEQVRDGPPVAPTGMEFRTEIYCFRCGEVGWRTSVRVVPATVKWAMKGRTVEVEHEAKDAGKRVDVWITHERTDGPPDKPGTTYA